jgi:hypothetical protein
LHLIQSKDLRKLLRMVRACAEFEPPAKPAPAELTKLFESVASFANMGAGSDWLIIALHTGQD